MSGPGNVVRALAARWHVSEGQVYTAVIGVVVALAAAIGGIPPTLVDRIEAPERNTSRVSAGRPSAPADEETTADAPASGTADAPLQFPGAGVVPTATFSDSGFTPPTSPPATAPPAPARRPAGDYRVFATVPSPGAPQGIAVAPDGRVLVATNNGGGRGADGSPVVVVYDDDGKVTQTVTASKVTSGGGLHDLVLPPGGNGDVAYALASEPAAVLMVEVPEAKVSSFASIPDIPPCTPLQAQPCEPAPVDSAPRPVAAVFDSSGALVVADAGQAVLWRVKADRSVSLLFKAVEFVGVDGLAGLARGADDKLYVSVARSTTSGRGVIYTLADGKLTQFATTEASALPRGLAVARSGRVYAALSGTGQVLVLNADGTPQSTLPTDAALRFDTPVRVAFNAVALMVVEHAPSRPQAGRVIELGVADEPASAS